MLDDARASLVADASNLERLAIGGTAVGTGLNTTEGFAEAVADRIAALTGTRYVSAPNKFAALASLDPLVRTSAGLRNLAVSLFKIANDIRWLGSGPRTGLGELELPANEPGSSIMPGKVNPTQAEALTMVTVQVLGNDATIAIAGKEGNLQLNTFRPVVIANLLHSLTILGDACDRARRHMFEGISLNRERIDAHVGRSAMMITALAPVIGYDRAAAIAHRAVAEDLTLRDAALRSGVDAELFDRVVVPLEMTRPAPLDGDRQPPG
jgi:fumarate hydratase class II